MFYALFEIMKSFLVVGAVITPVLFVFELIKGVK